jgi:hypothetical protein
MPPTATKKMASQKFSNGKALDDAAREGKYLVAKVIKSVGNCAFEAKLQLPNGKIQDVKVLIRGKMRGGKNCVTRVEKDCYVLVENSDQTKLMEVVGVINRQTDLERLRKSARISAKLAAEGDDHGELDDLFDRSGETGASAAAGDQPEHDSLADELVMRYQKRLTGTGATKAKADLLRGSTLSEEELDDSDGVQQTARKRRKAAATAAPSPPTELQPWSEATAVEVQPSYEEETDMKAAHVAPTRWDDDEINIDDI